MFYVYNKFGMSNVYLLLWVIVIQKVYREKLVFYFAGLGYFLIIFIYILCLRGVEFYSTVLTLLSEFMFSTEEDYKYIIIECYYKNPSLNYYRGNLLIDNFSVFEMCDRA